MWEVFTQARGSSFLCFPLASPNVVPLRLVRTEDPASAILCESDYLALSHHGSLASPTTPFSSLSSLRQARQVQHLLSAILQAACSRQHVSTS